MSEHTVYRIIKKMSASEKAYFKKYAFKKKGKQNESYKLFFDELDKLQEYDLDKIRANKKLPLSIKKDIHNSLKNLNNKLTKSLIEYRSEKKENKFFEYIYEYRLYKDLQLNDMAEKALLKAEKFVNDNDLTYLKPYVLVLLGAIMRNNISQNIDLLDEYVQKQEIAVKELNIANKINLIGYGLERLFRINGGVVIKDEKYIPEIDKLIAQGKEILATQKLNFYKESVLVNSLFILQLISKRENFIEDIFESFTENYEKKIDVSSGNIAEASLILKNILIYAIFFSKPKLFKTVKYNFILLENKVKFPDHKKFIQERIIYIEFLNKAVYFNTDLSSNKIEKGIQLYQSLRNDKAQKVELLIPILIILYRKKNYDRVIDLATNFINNTYSLRVRDDFLTIKILLAIAWYKKGNIELNQSILRSIYRILLLNDSFTLQKALVGFLRKTNKIFFNTNLLKALVDEEVNKIMTKGTGTERMKAIELKNIAYLVF